ncbi:MAG: hypothetical protein ABIF40_00925 [archaeon]
MKELLMNKIHVPMNQASNLILLDTCFIIDCISRSNKVNFSNTGITSFNIEELLHVEHRLGHLKKPLRKFLKDTEFVIVDVPVSLGDWKAEKDFVKSVDSGLLQHIADASDAVLIATAVKTQSNVLTKDKHHLFTVELENFVRDWNVKVFKELKDV